MLRPIVSFVVAISVLGPYSTSSLAALGKWGSTDDVKTIIAQDATWTANYCKPGQDLSFVADDFHGTRRNGTRYGHDIAVSHDPKYKGRDCRIGDVDVRFFNDTMAMAYGSEGWINIAQDGKESKYCGVWSDGWVKRDGKWLLVSAQDVVVSCDEWWQKLRPLHEVIPAYKE